MTAINLSTSTKMSSDKILHQAIIHRDLVQINSILQANVGWKATDDDGETVLHLAFKNKNRILHTQQATIIETLQCFMNEGLSVNVKNAVGQTILFSAVEERLRNVIDFLIQQGADLKARDLKGNTILHFLIEDQFKRYSENCKRNNRFTLQEFVEQEDIDFLNWLLSKGVNVDCKNEDGMTSLHVAIERNLQHVMPVLIGYMNHVNYIDEAGCTIIELFFKKKTSMNMRYELVPTYVPNYYYDCRYDIDIVDGLLKKGVSIDHVDKMGSTLVHTFLKSYDENPEIIHMMLQLYTKINAKNKDGDTALHLVMKKFPMSDQSKKHRMGFVRTLLSKGANVHWKNNSGETAVRLAFRVKNLAVVETLLEYGADLRPSQNPGGLFLHDIGIVSYLHNSIDDDLWERMLDKLLHAGWDVNAIRPTDGYTPLIEACRFGCSRTAQKLISNGANVNYAEETNLTRAMHVVVSKQLDYKNKAATLFQILANAGADVNVKNVHGETALHLAGDRDYNTIKTLLDLGADVEASDRDGRLPLHEAVKEDNVGAIRALLEYGADVNDEGVLRELNDVDVEDFDEDVDNSEETVDYLTKHWIKVRAANLPVTDGFVEFADHENFREFYVECLAEVETLKTHQVDDRTTLYDLLHMDVRLRCVFMTNNDELKKLVESPYLKNSFPEYHTLILACYNKAVARRPLIEPAMRAWYSLTGIDLPDLCVSLILFYLKNEDLRLMAREENEINSLKRPSQLTFDESAKKKRLSE